MSTNITTVSFHGDQLQTVRDGERVWVVVKRVCEALGVDESGQRQKLSEKPWATAELVSAVAEDSKTRELFCVDIDTLPMWLATIDVGRVRPEAREKLSAYQRECAQVLRDHFFGKPAATGLDLSMATAIAERAAALAAESHEGRIAHVETRLNFIEMHLAKGGVISVATHKRLTADVGILADTEVSSGRWLKSNQARADIYRELREVTGWGDKGKPWRLLPVALEHAAFAVVRRRQADSARILSNRQLILIAGKKRSGGGTE